MTVSLLQIGMPGATELIIMLFMFLFYIAVPVILVVLLVRYLGRPSDDERVRELEREVSELRGRLDEREPQREDE